MAFRILGRNARTQYLDAARESIGGNSPSCALCDHSRIRGTETFCPPFRCNTAGRAYSQASSSLSRQSLHRVGAGGGRPVA